MDIDFSFINGDITNPVVFSVLDTDFPQNYVHLIEQVDRSQEGVYTAQASSK